MTADDAVTAALGALAQAFDMLGAPAMIVGGIAVIARGVPRTTLDIDAAVWAESVAVDRTLAVFQECGLVPRIADPRLFAEDHQVIPLRHAPSGTPVDVTLATLPFERHALAHATRIDFGGPSLPVVSAEDLIIYKAVAWRARDRDDVERLLVIHRPHVDIARIRAVIAEFCMLLGAPERLADFDAMLARVQELS